MSLVFSSELSLFSLKYKSDVVFAVFISMDQNLMKLEKRSIIYLIIYLIKLVHVSNDSQNMFVIYVIY